MHLKWSCSILQSPSLHTLSLKFWDFAASTHRAVQLQCPYSTASSTMTDSSTSAKFPSWPFQPQKPSISYFEPSKNIDSSHQFQYPTVPFFNPPKATVASFQRSIDPQLTSLTSKFTWSTQTTTLASQMHQPQVFCHSKEMIVTLPPGPITGLTVRCELFIYYYYKFLVVTYVSLNLHP